MPILNADIADIFNKVAKLLEIRGSNPFRVRAYRNAARTVSSLPRKVSELIEENYNLKELSGIGNDLAGKITEIVNTGTLSQLEELEEKTPKGLDKVMNIEGLGPKRTNLLHRKLGISNLKELGDAAEKGEIHAIKGFGKKTEQKILEAIKKEDKKEKRIKLPKAEQRAESIVDFLRKIEGINKISVAGSFRRKKETVGDLDILVTADKKANVIDKFVLNEDIHKVISKGKTRSTVLLRSDLQVDLRVVPNASYGAALHYFTGSKSHNIAVRKLGTKKGFKINEYGVFQGKKRIAGKTEEEVYNSVGLPYIEPELRENMGEIEAAQKGRLPVLIELEDLRGDLHIHTNETDGSNSLEEMAAAAKKRGYRYLAITDHSKRVTMAKGLDIKKLKKQIKKSTV